MEQQQQNNDYRDVFERTGENIRQTIQPFAENVNNGVGGINETLNNVKTSVQNTLNDFSSKSAVDAGNDFLQSNSIISKFAFLILVLILFVFIFNLGVKLLGTLTKPTKSPFIVKGMIPATKGIVITQDPNSTSSITVQRSNNNKTGIEFTWSVWLYVSGNGNTATYSHVFNKGDGAWDSTTGISKVNNAPGLYLKNTSSAATAGTMALHIVMDTEDIETQNAIQTLDINEIPLQKWFNVCIRMQNVIMDVYVNGTNSGRLILPSVPRQNYNDINVCQNGGFSGNLSNLRYYDRALTAFEINGIVFSGPNLKTSTSVNNTTATNGTNYLSGLWYFNKM
jgi:hypothetical protein